SDEVVDLVIAAIGRTRAPTVDITGGAPELHPRLRDLVDAAFAAGKHVMDRCNLTVLLLPRNQGLIDWFAERNVETDAQTPTRNAGEAYSIDPSRRCGCSTPQATGAAIPGNA